MTLYSKPHNEGILILDYGSQYTLLIARKLREARVYCEIVPPTEVPIEHLFNVRGIILSGGPDSVDEEGSRSLPSWVIDARVPLLGICYGLQLLVRHFGGTIRSGTSREYGRAPLTVLPRSTSESSELVDDMPADLWEGLPNDHEVWMSHGDDIAHLPARGSRTFEVRARTPRSVAGIACLQAPYYGLQYHPEVHHTDYGSALLARFVEVVCGLTEPWDGAHLLSSLVQSLKDNLPQGRVLVACSGGVDSTVAFVLLNRALGADRVKGVLIDTGLLRFDEARRITKMLSPLGVSLDVLQRSELFYERLGDVSDPEEKRKIIGATFVDVFGEYAREHKDDFEYLAQGTLYSDVIESGGGGSSPQVIKTHHNVGGLPDQVPFEIVEPLRYLFKDEVRALGAEMGIDNKILWQHPFPGPGLGVRIPGAIDAQRVRVLQKADAIYIAALHEWGLYEKVWQAFAVLLPVRSVGVMGDGRTYEEVVSLRAVDATDAMTAQVAQLPHDFLTQVAEKIVSSVQGVNRVLYDITTKPPATIEWE